MPKPMTVARPFFVMLIIFTVVRLVLSSRGVPYENPRAASISLVVLTYVCAIMTAALARGLVGLSLKQAATTGALMGFASQVVIFVATMISIAAGVQTYFNYAPAINDALIGKEITMASALPYRGVALIIAPIATAIAASIGWLIGGTMGRRA
jgi:hypothetical protein